MTAEEIVNGKSALCRSILESLPDWFAIPESVDRYVAEAAHLPMFGVRIEGEIAGFATLEKRNPHVAEIHVMAVRQAYHRRGIGRALLAAVESLCRGGSIEILLVKTLAPSSDYHYYVATREFYLAMGFRPLLESDAIWGPENPCLLMGKAICARRL